MFRFLRLWFGALARVFCTRQRLALENLALRQQLAALKRKNPRPRVGLLDKFFWVIARRFWAEWKSALNRHARHRSPMASSRIPHVLGFHLQSTQASWQEATLEGGARSHISNGHRQPDLGCSPHSW